jgi:hypothetical protein
MADVFGARGAGGAGDAGSRLPLPPIPAVLVLCQRSRSSIDETVVDTVRGLLNFIDHGLGVRGDFRIRFCTPCEITQGDSRKKRKISDCDYALHLDPAGGDGDYADYNLKLDMSTLGKIKQLMDREYPPIESFKYVILHTCPFAFMEFEAISAIMEPGDTMIMTRASGRENEIVVVPIEVIRKHLANSDKLYSRIHMFFDDVDDKPGVYKKKDEPPRKRNRKEGGKKKGRKNTLRYKPIKYRRYHRTRRSGSKKLK